MAKNNSFHFKQFSVHQNHCAMKVSTDACLFGAQTAVHDCQRILDIGTGTGLLALMAAQRSNAIIEAVELDQTAAEQAKENFSQSPWAGNLTVHSTSIQQFAHQQRQVFDLIICNPPFFTDHTSSPNALRNQARHNDSLPFSDLVRAADTLLADGGSFEVLLPTSEYQRFLTVAREHGFAVSTLLHIQPTPTKAIHREIIKLYKGKDTTGTPAQQELVLVKEANGEYSPRFQQLLQPYYLKL